MKYDAFVEAMGCTNELFYRNGPSPQPIQAADANLMFEKIKQYLEEAYKAGKEGR